jgi:hypothetical protein
MALENAQLKTTTTDLLVVPSGKSFAITTILVCNTYSVNDPNPESRSASFDLHLIKNGQALNNKVTVIVRDLELPAGETFTFDSEKIILDEGDKISFVAEPDIGSSLTDLAATISYLEV